MNKHLITIAEMVSRVHSTMQACLRTVSQPLVQGTSTSWAQLSHLVSRYHLAPLTESACKADYPPGQHPGTEALWLCTVQIWRTEHYSNKLQEGSALPLMSVVVATIAAASLGLTVLEHIPQSLSWAQHPAQILAEWSAPSFSQVFPVVWSALMSTDLVLLIEVALVLLIQTAPAAARQSQENHHLLGCLQVLALHDVSSTDASIIYSMEPLLGAGFAYLLLGEQCLEKSVFLLLRCCQQLQWQQVLTGC